MTTIPVGERRPARPTRFLPAVSAASGQVGGLGLAAAIGLAATAVGAACPVIGAPVVAVVGGALLSPLARRWREVVQPGLDVARVRLLRLSVVLLGAQLSLGEVARAGVASLPVMLATLAACLAGAALLGRGLRVGRDLCVLIGVGTAICGASAIAATSPTIRAKDPDVTYAVSTIFLFNVAAVLVFPPLGHALGLSPNGFGLFAGTAVNDMSSVAAAAGAYGPGAVQQAVVVKLVRTLMIIPIVLTLGALVRRREAVVDPETAVDPEPAAGPRRRRGRGGLAGARRAVRLVPGFLVGFVLVAAAHSAGLLPAVSHEPLRRCAMVLIAVALAAIGLATDVAALRRTGFRPLLLGLLLWVTVSLTSLAVAGAV
ncbi:putative sulfate exporter family transporter [Frankia sp. AgB1.9]|uniref:YeiH family protein n=1 Tax=unclassified Frankia TaxID=2632575 RepID=UPI001932DEF3|nr:MULTISPECIES: putative sulfate exporter family transporter [unclassified Frankia]MBL7491732.1 putative sulfate exporter family transporter [Frankia sp. AgW1.1]MBL7550825.1 putative sulfate exporter family transporter [Frankia sp. AgB1.9]MBL7625146.1 putative sulfate exporter family transporter [Frankia sp. AgB1.8]